VHTRVSGRLSSPRQDDLLSYGDRSVYGKRNTLALHSMLTVKERLLCFKSKTLGISRVKNHIPIPRDAINY
jgi:hypothetical protein